MGIEKMKLLAHECVYWYSINADIKNTLNNVQLSGVSANAAKRKDHPS